MKADVREILKNAALCVLSLLALWLAWNTWIYEPALSPIAGGHTGGGGMASVLTAAAKPGSGMLSGDAGRASAGFGGADMQVLYLRTAPLLGEAMGSASSPENVSEDQWLSALRGRGVFLDYFSPVPLGALAAWFGTSTAVFSDMEASEMLLTPQNGDDTSFFFRDGATGSYYRSACAVNGVALSQLISEYEPDGSFFAFEHAAVYKNVPPETIIRPGDFSLPEIRASNPLDAENSVRILRAVDMNPYSNARYTEQDGTIVYVDNACTLRIGPGGLVRYSNKSEPGEALWNRLFISDKPDRAAVVEFVRRLADDAMSQLWGDAELYFDRLSELPSGGFRVTFRYVVNGIPVYPEGGKAADAVISGGRITELQLYVRRYETLREETALLPMTQAAALPTRQGGAIVTAYIDEAAGDIEPEWVLR